MQDEKKQGNKNFKIPKNMKKPGFNSTWIYIVLAGLFIILSFMDLGGNGKEISWKQLIPMIQSHDIQKIIIVNKEKAEIYLKPEAKTSDKYKDLLPNNKVASSSVLDFYMTIGSIDSFEEKVKEIQKEVPIEDRLDIKYEDRTDYLGDIMGWLLPLIIFLGIWFFIFRRMAGGMGGSGGSQIFNIGKSKAKVFDNDSETKSKITFLDVAGLEEAKEEVMEVVDFLKNKEKYTRLGGKIPKGVLLVGPPGTGKTLLAKAVAGEASVPFFSMSGSDFVEMFVGVGASRVRDLFKQAKQKSPCIVFIDEIDAVGRARGKNAGFSSNDERENTLNQLLTEMDGFESNSGVIIIAATNRSDVLDPALLRAGRFDRQIHVELPDLVGRKEIFKVHSKDLKLAEDVDLDMFAKQTPGFSGADIANVCNESALIAARNKHDKIYKQDFLDAIDRIIGGLEKKTRIIMKSEKKRIAYHEAGHATVSWFLEHAHPLVKVTIVPRGRALGAAWYMPEERQLTTKVQLFDDICATLGGRASEEVIFGEVSTGALDDLDKVTQKSYAMISYFGMSDKVGNISFYNINRSDYMFTKPYGDDLANIIDNEVKSLIEEQYDRAKAILMEHEGGLKEVAELLYEKEVLYPEDLERIFGERPWKPEETEIVKKKENKEEQTDENSGSEIKEAPKTEESTIEESKSEETENSTKETDEPDETKS